MPERLERWWRRRRLRRAGILRKHPRAGEPTGVSIDGVPTVHGPEVYIVEGDAGPKGIWRVEPTETITTNHGRTLPAKLTHSTHCHPCCGGVKGAGRPEAGHEVGCVDYAQRVAGSGAFDA